METNIKQKRLTPRQKRWLKAYKDQKCHKTNACVATRISRQTIYRWRDENDVFKKEMEDVEEQFYDDLELAMRRRAIVDKSDTMLIWLSKTKMKHRGYIEKTEVEHDASSTFLEAMKRASKLRKEMENEQSG